MGIFLRPSLAPETGPFQGEHGGWGPVGKPDDPEIRYVAASLYCALVTATCLELTGHRGEIVIEGPFARNLPYLQMLATATDVPVVAATGQTGTSQGAALLVEGPTGPRTEDRRILPADAPEGMADYAAAWRRLV